MEISAGGYVVSREIFPTSDADKEHCSTGGIISDPPYSHIERILAGPAAKGDPLLGEKF